MKNLNIEKFDKLPFRESILNRVKYGTKIEKCRRNYKRGEYHKINNYSPFEIVIRVLNYFVGRPFDEAFSYYCKKVPKYQQKYFLDEFNNSKRWRYSYYTIDTNDNIQHNTESFNWKRDKIVSIQSDDYQTEQRHKITNHKELDFKAIYEKIPRIVKYKTFVPYEYIITEKIVYDRGKFLYYRHKNGYVASDKDFISVVSKGWKLYFTSKNDPSYQKLYKEQNKAKKKSEREKLKQSKDWDSLMKSGTMKIIDFKKKQQAEIKRQEESNVQNIVRHGFDPITSFRTTRA